MSLGDQSNFNVSCDQRQQALGLLGGQCGNQLAMQAHDDAICRDERARIVARLRELRGVGDANVLAGKLSELIADLEAL